MPTKRFDNIDPSRKKKILDAARAEFIRSGYDGASLNDIIREAEISKGSLYYYFEDKVDVFITVLTEVMKEIQQQVGGIILGEFSDDFWIDIENYIKKTIQFSLENPGIIHLARGLESILATDPHNKSINEFFNSAKSITADILKRGQDMGEVRRDIPLEMLTAIIYNLGETMDYWVFDHWETFTHEEVEKIHIIYTDIFRRIAGIEPVKGYVEG